MANPEQRRHPRIRRRFPVTIGARGRSFVAVSEDLSPSGLLVRCSEILHPGTAISGTLDLDGQILSFGAMVRWSRSASRSNSNETQHSMGLAFLSTPGALYLAYFEKAVAELGVGFDAASSPATARPAPAVPPATAASTEKAPRIPPRATPAGGVPAAIPRAVTAPAIPPPFAVAAPQEDVARESRDAPVLGSGLVPGLIGKCESNTKATDSKVRGASAFAPSSAALLFERAAVQAVAGAIPAGTQTLGISLTLNMNRPPHVMLGARLEAVATLLSISPDRTLRFQVELREGDRLVASGEHQRILVAG
jgi:predicted thioesterase